MPAVFHLPTLPHAHTPCPVLYHLLQWIAVEFGQQKSPAGDEGAEGEQDRVLTL